MDTHRLTADSGAEFEIVLNEDGRIVDVAGAWPGEGGEFTLQGPLPAHARVDEAPSHIHAAAAKRGMDVCFYDPDGCRTCYCDEKGRMHCVGIC